MMLCPDTETTTTESQAHAVCTQLQEAESLSGCVHKLLLQEAKKKKSRKCFTSGINEERFVSGCSDNSSLKNLSRTAR
jgi:hypothetical protein